MAGLWLSWHVQSCYKGAVPNRKSRVEQWCYHRLPKAKPPTFHNQYICIPFFLPVKKLSLQGVKSILRSPVLRALRMNTGRIMFARHASRMPAAPTPTHIRE